MAMEAEVDTRERRLFCIPMGIASHQADFNGYLCVWLNALGLRATWIETRVASHLRPRERAENSP